MKGNFEASLAHVLVYEGGLAKLPHDPGGLTNRGITQATYDVWRASRGLPQQSVATISREDVATIYKQDYWDRVRCDAMPSGVDFCLFDAAVNSGVGGATSWAQAVVRVTIDGDMGPKTEAAVAADDPGEFVRDFCARRLGTLERLPTWRDFGRGWAARVANVQRVALAMVEGAPKMPDPAAVSTVGGAVKANPADVPQSKVGQIVAHITTAGGVAGTAAAQAGQQLAPASDTFPMLKYVLGGLTVLGVIAGIVVLVTKSINDAAASGTRVAKVNPDADAGLVVALPTGGTAHG